MNRSPARKVIPLRQASGAFRDLPVHLPDRVVILLHRNPLRTLKQQRFAGIGNVGDIDLRHRICLYPKLRIVRTTNIFDMQGYIIKSGFGNLQARVFRMFVPLNVLPSSARTVLGRNRPRIVQRISRRTVIQGQFEIGTPYGIRFEKRFLIHGNHIDHAVKFLNTSGGTF